MTTARDSQLKTFLCWSRCENRTGNVQHEHATLEMCGRVLLQHATQLNLLQISIIWVWLKIKELGLRRFWSMFPLARVPVWYRFFGPQPYYDNYIYLGPGLNHID